MRSRQGGMKLVQSVVWDQIRSAYLSTGGAGSENVSETLNLLSDAKPVRVFMAPTRQPLADRNGRDGATQDGRRGNIDEMSGAQAQQKLAEARNIIAQLRKYQEPFKRQRREGWSNRRGNGNDSHGHEQQRARRNVTVPAGPGPKPACVTSEEVQVNMLRTSRESSDSDEEPEHEPAYFVRARMEQPIRDVQPG